MRIELTRLLSMNIKWLVSLKLIGIFLLVSSASTYAASNSSLWGDIDEPVPPTKQIEQQAQQLQAEQAAIDNQKTICELFTAQTALPSDSVNVAKIQDALARAYKIVLPEYKMLIADKDAANNLYIQYRDLYLKTYCIGSK